MKTLRGWLGAAHPFPLAMVLLLTALIAFATADGRPASERLVLLLGAMLFSQLAIGWSNDYLDRDVDAVHQPSKPVPSGLVDARMLPPAIVVVLLTSALMGAFLGLLPLLLLVIGTLCGLVYNFGLKRTPLSAAPFLVAFTVLPLFVWTGLGVYRGDLLALYPIGLSLPVAVHIANVLPDLHADTAQAHRTVAVRLGRRRAIALTLLCQFLPLVLTLISLALIDYDAAVLAASLGAYGTLSGLAALLYAAEKRERDVQAFRLIVVAAIVFASGWLAAI